MSATSPDPTPRPRQRDDRTRALVPTFAAPTPQEGTEELTPAGNPPTPGPGPAAPANDGEAAPPFPGRGDPPTARTATSTTGDDERGPAKPLTANEVTGLMVGLLGLAVTVAGGLVRWQARARGRDRRLREPTPTQQKQIAAPLGRILARRADLSLLGPDIGDALQAAAATGAYLGDGPLLTGAIVDDGVPHDIQETQ